MTDDDLFDRFGDLLREVPEAEDALRAWRDKQALDGVRRAIARDREQRLHDAYAWCARRRRGLPDTDA